QLLIERGLICRRDLRLTHVGHNQLAMKPFRNCSSRFDHFVRIRPGRDAYQNALLCSELLRSEEHTSELQSRFDLVCRLLTEKQTLSLQRGTTRYGDVGSTSQPPHLTVPMGARR